MQLTLKRIEKLIKYHKESTADLVAVGMSISQLNKCDRSPSLELVEDGASICMLNQHESNAATVEVAFAQVFNA